VLLGGAVGGLVGLVAGFFGGLLDRVPMRLADIQVSFPYILVSLALVAVLGPSMTIVIVVLGLASWPIYARAVRGAVLAEQDLLDLRAVDDHRDDGLAALGDLARRGRHVAAVLARPLVRALARAVEDGQLEAGARQVRRLARAHDAQTYESHRHAKALARACECE
jgi:ABC-type antimicrobial peptide transport system permease subunit